MRLGEADYYPLLLLPLNPPGKASREASNCMSSIYGALVPTGSGLLRQRHVSSGTGAMVAQAAAGARDGVLEPIDL
ncbi:hypothetical protein XA68_15158 [Ophiocordyceps unilateralis]|uniref:Uncharacterized protein n=1 Tax=Ophiocordyceps unilateralis TaxID=268505 RepID=A0A2A9P7G3_OPHUN|nr:hypothetical protein XA68_15158 [Ophiocordyceps unilateralis]